MTRWPSGSTLGQSLVWASLVAAAFPKNDLISSLLCLPLIPPSLMAYSFCLPSQNNACNYEKCWTVDHNRCLFWVNSPSLVSPMLSCSWLGLTFVLIKGHTISFRRVGEEFFTRRLIIKTIYKKCHNVEIYGTKPI